MSVYRVGNLAENFDALFANICEALQREQRISYRALRRRFELSDDDLEDIADELIHATQWASDENNLVLEWIGIRTHTSNWPRLC